MYIKRTTEITKILLEVLKNKNKNKIIYLILYYLFNLSTLHVHFFYTKCSSSTVNLFFIFFYLSALLFSR